MQSFCLPAAYFDIVVVAGPDSVKFLQGQLTCDVESLADGCATWGAICNNKGRVHATFLLARHRAALVLILARGLGDILAGTLRKFQPFYKCTLELNPAGRNCNGLAGTDATTMLSAHVGVLPGILQLQTLETGWLCLLGAGQYLWCTFDSLAPSLPPGVELQPGSLEQWQILDMRAGRFPFSVSDSGLYTPQELHLDRSGYVSFSKGCYTGQEIVARMHYRGKPKKQLYLLETTGCDLDSLARGFDVMDDKGTIVGHTIKQAASSADDRLFALAQLPVEFAGLAPTLQTGAGKPLVLLPF